MNLFETCPECGDECDDGFPNGRRCPNCYGAGVVLVGGPKAVASELLESLKVMTQRARTGQAINAEGLEEVRVALAVIEKARDPADYCVGCGDELGTNKDEAHEDWDGLCPTCVDNEDPEYELCPTCQVGREVGKPCPGWPGEEPCPEEQGSKPCRDCGDPITEADPIEANLCAPCGRSDEAVGKAEAKQ